MRRLWPLALLCLTCRSPVNPDQGRFTCGANKDCGPGWECIAQSGGGGFCFKEGACVIEECNGLDDNCDGRIDESFSAQGDVCPTGRPGPCNDGRNVCADGGIVCVAQYTPVVETCNGVDDDCANGIDDTFNLIVDNANCGACGRVCFSGSMCLSGTCREIDCGDGLDNDDGGLVDCADPSCVSIACGLDGGFNCGLGNPIDAGSGDAGSGDGGMDDA